jgi:hypothetical protein
MKRSKKIIADDGGTRVVISIQFDTRRCLVRDEVDELVEGLTSAIMAQIPGQRYLHVPLSRLKVAR